MGVALLHIGLEAQPGDDQHFQDGWLGVLHYNLSLGHLVRLSVNSILK